MSFGSRIFVGLPLNTELSCLSLYVTPAKECYRSYIKALGCHFSMMNQFINFRSWKVLSQFTNFELVSLS